MDNSNPAIRLLLDGSEAARKRVKALQSQLAAARTEMKAIEAALLALGASGADADKVQPFKPTRTKLKDRVFGAIEADGGKSTADIQMALGDKGINTILSTLSRLKREGRIVKRDRLWYVATTGDNESNKTAPDNESGAA